MQFHHFREHAPGGKVEKLSVRAGQVTWTVFFVRCLAVLGWYLLMCMHVADVLFAMELRGGFLFYSARQMGFVNILHGYLAVSFIIFKYDTPFF